MNKLTQIALAASVSTAALASAAFAESRTETLSSNSLITIALVDAHHEHRNVFMDELFPSVLPAIEEVGGRLVATFETIDVEEGDYTPQHIMLLEWPSVEAFESCRERSAQPGRSGPPRRSHARFHHRFLHDPRRRDADA